LITVFTSALQENTQSQVAYISRRLSVVLMLKPVINNNAFQVFSCRKDITYQDPIFIYPQAYYKNTVTNKRLYRQWAYWYFKRIKHSTNYYCLMGQPIN